MRIMVHRLMYVRAVMMCSVVLCSVVSDSLMMFYMLGMGDLLLYWTVGQE